jgi:mannan endo-1,4-beta-mannosidase
MRFSSDILAFVALLSIAFISVDGSRSLIFEPSAEISQEVKFANSQLPDFTAATTSGKNQGGFVTVKGTEFYLNGRPWHCAGTNAYYAAITDRLTPQEVDQLFKTHAEKKATVIRVFAHSDGAASTSNPIQPSLGVYNENALKRLDLVLFSAAKYGIRLILPFTNYEPFLGGIQWYAEQVAGLGADKEVFYTNSKARGAYRSYVAMILNRKNTINNLRYSNDPTIFALELMNEPHTRDNWEKNRGLSPQGKIVGDWIRDMAKFIKGIDSNHILLTGEEGYRTKGPSTMSSGKHVWINNGLKGVDFARNCADPNIDACTIHAYPDNWGYSADQYRNYGKDFMADRAAVARSLNKPILMEEYGMRKGYLPTRDELMRYLQNEAEKAGFACSLVWSASVGNIGKDRGSSYIFKYGEDGSAALAEAYYNETPPSTPCKDVPPSADYTCAQQKKWGKCGESWMTGYCQITCGTCKQSRTLARELKKMKKRRALGPAEEEESSFSSAPAQE